MDSCNGSKSKSLPPSRVLEDKRRSNSRGAVSQSRDQDNIEKKSKEIVKETPEEREEREFADKLKRAETQEDRDRLIARRQKFTNKVQKSTPMVATTSFTRSEVIQYGVTVSP